jgi:hypothetical protein
LDSIEKVSPIEPIAPIRPIRMRRFNHERREQKYQFKRLHKGHAKKRWFKKKGGGSHDSHNDSKIQHEQEQDFLNYKNDLKKRLTFDRAMILYK